MVIGKPVIFLRYNPDKYKPAEGQAMESQGKRRETLVRWLEHVRKTPPPEGEFAVVVQLFFDGYCPSSVEMVSLMGHNEAVA